MSQALRIATRKSPLALWQANYIKDALNKRWPEIEVTLVPMSTSGDKFLKDRLQAIGGKGLFVKELEEALLDGRADLAVHSMKDVPAHFPEGLGLHAICQRDNPFDALLSLNYDSLNALPEGAIVGTSSLRRQAQLLAQRPDLVLRPLRGNIHTRIDQLATGTFDAIILAMAGMERMNLQDKITEQLNPQLMLPACGQGALGLECRNDDVDLIHKIAFLNHDITSICVHAERKVNALLGGNCHVPLAVFAQSKSSTEFMIEARVARGDGSLVINAVEIGEMTAALQLAQACADNLRRQGAQEILDEDHT